MKILHIIILLLISHYSLFSQNIIWEKEYQSENRYNSVFSSYIDYDGNILLLGMKDSVTTRYNTEQAYIRKIDAKDGKLIWQYSFGDLNDGTYTRLQKIELLPDSTFLALGTIAPYVTYENRAFWALNLTFPFFIHFSKNGEVLEKHFDSIATKEFYGNVKIALNKIGKSFIAAGINNTLIGNPKLQIQFFDTNGRYSDEILLDLIELEIYWADLKWTQITSKKEVIMVCDILDSKDKLSGNLIMIIDSNRKIIRKTIINYNLTNPKITDATTDMNGDILLYGAYNSNNRNDSNQLFLARVNNEGNLYWFSNFEILDHAYPGKILINKNNQLYICGACTELDSLGKAIYGKRKNYVASITANNNDNIVSKFIWGDYKNGIGLSGMNILSEDTLIVAGTMGYPVDNRLGDNEVKTYVAKIFIKLTKGVDSFFISPRKLELF